MVGRLLVIVLIFKFHQNRLSSYRDFMGQILGSCLTFANGFYTALCYRTGVIRELFYVVIFPFIYLWTPFLCRFDFDCEF